MKHVGVLHGGMHQGLDNKVSQGLNIARYNEMGGSPNATSSSTAYLDVLIHFNIVCHIPHSTTYLLLVRAVVLS